MPYGLPPHVIAAVAMLAATVAIRALTRNHVVRNRLRLTIALLLALLALEAVVRWAVLAPDLRSSLAPIGRLLFALATIHLGVLVLINPLRVDRVPERFPTIVQDAIIIGLFVVVSTFVLDEKFVTTSAVGAVVVGFALQDTLGNMFSGLALQIEKPFQVGHWISAGDNEGSVIEVTWRAIKLRTRQGNLVTVPNSEIAKAAVTNYSEPVGPSRIALEVGASYAAPPNYVKDAIFEVLEHEPLVLKTPPPQVQLVDFAASSITYRAQFWIDNQPQDDVIRDKVRCGIYYIFARRKIEIPFPIQVEYEREETHESESDRATRVQRLLDGVPLFARLSDAERRTLAYIAQELTYGRGEAIVRESEAGDSAFVIAGGRVRVAIGREQHEVAVIEQGGYFGEMSLLTGDARSATVAAIDDCRVVEITASDFREVVLKNPAILDVVTADVARRRAELDAARSAAARAVHPPEGATSLLERVRRFLLGSVTG